MIRLKKILTVILDGFGLKEEEEGNAPKKANMPCFKMLWESFPHAYLKASEEAVGLHEGQAGNSEVGHITIGAGRILKQPEILVDEFLKNPDKENENVIKLMSLKDKTIHLMGLCSDGNVHAGVDDFLAMYNFLVQNGFKDIVFHLITDGRDTPVNSAYSYIKQIEDAIKKQKVGIISTVCGRYYAMDRDQNWDRTQVYYNLVTKGLGKTVLSIEASLKKSYENGITDEFIKPIVLSNKLIKDGDVLLWMNYRTDRAKQILSAFVNYETLDAFKALPMPNLNVFAFLEVDEKIKTNNFLVHDKAKQPMGIYLSELGLTQARIAESEKYNHVTYFFDGEFGGKIPKCDKFHIPSPKVATYDLCPEMSAYEVTKKVVSAMEQDYDFILVNYANPDMVGHTGVMEAAVKACEVVDSCLNTLVEKAEENFYKIFILADHGNCDTMLNLDGTPCTTHSTALVPFILLDKKAKLKNKGSLINVAPTILDYMDIAIPKEMEETESLLIEE